MKSDTEPSSWRLMVVLGVTSAMVGVFSVRSRSNATLSMLLFPTFRLPVSLPYVV